MEDIKNYKAKSHSVSHSQVLFSDYPYEKAKLVFEEMARTGCLELMRRKLISGRISLFVGYSKDAHAPTGGSRKLPFSSNLPKKMVPALMALFEETTLKSVPIRRLGVGFELLSDESCEGYDLFTNWEEVEKEKRVNRAALEIQKKFGKNALVTAADLQEGATLLERNKLIGGHNADG